MLGARQDSTFTWALSLFKWAGHCCQAARGALRWGSAVWPAWAELPSGAALLEALGQSGLPGELCGHWEAGGRGLTSDAGRHR